jgi:hypothetical protein
VERAVGASEIWGRGYRSGVMGQGRTQHGSAEMVSRAVCIKRLARSVSGGLAEGVPAGRDDNKGRRHGRRERRRRHERRGRRGLSTAVRGGVAVGRDDNQGEVVSIDSLFVSIAAVRGSLMHWRWEVDVRRGELSPRRRLLKVP